MGAQAPGGIGGNGVIEAPDIDRLLAGPLGQWLARQAEVRAAAKAQSNRRFLIAGLVLVPALVVLALIPGISFDFVLYGGVFAAIGASAWAWAPRAKAIKDTKRGINAALAEAMGLAYAHDCEPGAGFARARRFSMLPGFTRSHFEDLWSGEVGGLAFTLHEAHLEERRGSGRNQRWVTVFRGPVITLASPRRFHATTLVERSGRHRRLGIFGESERIEREGRRLERVDMVHPEFEDAFTVYGSDPVEARWLVHPSYVERLIALERAFAGQDIRALFHEGEITIVLKAENMFESGHLDASRDRALIERTLAQFMAMVDLAASLVGPPR